MLFLPDDSILCLDATLLDEHGDDAILDALLLANSHDAIHDVDRDPNIHDEMASDATRPLGPKPSLFFVFVFICCSHLALNPSYLFFVCLFCFFFCFLFFSFLSLLASE